MADPKQLIADKLAQLKHAELLSMREGAPLDQQLQIAPFEHRAFAREAVQENPLMALSLPFAIPAYQAQKALMGGSRTPPSWEQVKQGYTGVGEGVQGLLEQLKARFSQ